MLVLFVLEEIFVYSEVMKVVTSAAVVLYVR